MGKNQTVVQLAIETAQCMMGCMAHGILVSQSTVPYAVMREREKLHYVHSASVAYEDGSVFMSGPVAEWL